MSEKAVQGTGDDAAWSKLSMISKKYWKDPFMEKFVGTRSCRRSPLINRGYFCRVCFIETTAKSFLKLKGCQIVSLGCGMDTLFFRLASQGLLPERFVEIDYEETTRRKADIIRKTDELRELVGEESTESDCEVRASCYNLVSCDLGNLDVLEAKLSKMDFDWSAPTLFLSECVMIYMEIPQSNALIQWVADKCCCAMFVTYEQILPDDPFGRTMLANLGGRGIHLRSIREFPDLKSQKERYLKCGFTVAQAVDLNCIYYRNLEPAEVKRIEKLELFDEFEEWWLMMGHYCVVVASKEPETEATSLFTEIRLNDAQPTGASIPTAPSLKFFE